MARTGWRGVLALGALVLAACNSTNRLDTSSDTIPALGEAGITAPGQTVPGGGETVATTPSGDPIVGETTTRAPGGTTGPATTRGAGGSNSTATTVRPGSTPTQPPPTGGTIVVGVHDDDPSTAFSSFGVKGGPDGDQQVHIRAIVKWINEHGGMGGRQVQLVSHVTQNINGTFDAQSQAACTALVEDGKAVVAVSGARTPTLNLLDCFARHHVPLVWSYHYYLDKQTYDQYAGYVYQPSMVRAERLGIYVDMLFDAKYFDKGVVGIVRFDRPLDERLSKNVIRPALARHGITVKEEAVITTATGAGSAGDMSAASSNAVLKFRQAGVNRVLFLPTHAVLPLLWFPAAEAQGFRPRYALTTYDNPAFQTDNAPPAQLAGALAVGWTPAGDVAPEQQPPLWPAAKLCVDITPTANPPRNGSVRRYCDGLMFLKAVFDAGAQPTPASIRAVVDRMGTGFDSPWTFRTRFGPGIWDGAAAAQLVAYDGPCDCFKLTGAIRDIP